jgi:hypothetical protein
MSIAITNWRSTMLKKILLITGATLGVSGVALANPPRWAPAHGYRAHYEHSRPYYVAQRPVYVAPRPVYVVPAPRMVYAAPPAPVYYPPAAVYSTPGVSIRLNLPL